MDSLYRIPSPNNWPHEWVDNILHGDALSVLKKLPDECVALAVTSPPYWNTVDYDAQGQIGQTNYDQYLTDLLGVWKETYRILIPNGKLAIVTPIMPIPKKVINNQHTRHLKNINNDIEHTILTQVNGFERYSLFVWQKQTSEKMFGSYPYPPNIYEDNTIEFINVLVKDGIPPPIRKEAKTPSVITQEEWRNLTMQVWPLYPEDIRRAGGHPCPFPIAIPLRIIMMYTFRKALEVGFEGDIVLDMFNGTGATCVASKQSGRNYIGIELNGEYCKIARQRVKQSSEYSDSQPILISGVKVKQAYSSTQLDLFPGEDIDTTD